MKKYCFIIFFLLFFQITFAQSTQLHTISGKVISKETGEPIQMVNVFLDATTLGTTTNNIGEFIIKGVPSGSYQIIVSMVGYERIKKEIKLIKKKSIKINFRLKTHAYQLDEVFVTTKRNNEWIDNSKIFQREILGKSINAEKCKILNTEVLEFSKSSRVKLKATANKPLEIMNYALGYKIFFDLIEFDLFNNNEVSYYGTIRFVELTTNNEDELSCWKENRETAYNGSFRDFLISLCHDELEENGFYTYVVKSPNWGQLRKRGFENPHLEKKIKRVSAIERELWFDDYIMVVYDNEWEEEEFLHYRNYLGSTIYRTLAFQTSWLKFPYGCATFDINGNIMGDYKNIKVFGYWGWEKLANLLPSNYQPEKE